MNKYLRKPRCIFVHEDFRLAMYPDDNDNPILEISNYEYDQDKGGPYYRTVYRWTDVEDNPGVRPLLPNSKGQWIKVAGLTNYPDEHPVWLYVSAIFESYLETTELLKLQLGGM